MCLEHLIADVLKEPMGIPSGKVDASRTGIPCQVTAHNQCNKQHLPSAHDTCISSFQILDQASSIQKSFVIIELLHALGHFILKA